jgi:hypothetical protein
MISEDQRNKKPYVKPTISHKLKAIIVSLEFKLDTLNWCYTLLVTYLYSISKTPFWKFALIATFFGLTSTLLGHLVNPWVRKKHRQILNYLFPNKN